MLHNEARKLLTKAFNKTHNAKEVAECLFVDGSTVYRLVRRMKTTGYVDTRISLRGCKPSLHSEDIQKIDGLLQN